MNFIQSIINFLLKLFGSAEPKKATPKPTPTPKPPKPIVNKPVAPTSIVPEIPITADVMKTSISLGHYDDVVPESAVIDLLEIYHVRFGNKRGKRFRHGDLFDWVDACPVAGTPVKTLQAFLVNAGILHPSTNLDGIFDYVIQAGVRMFQEYERIHCGNTGMIPNGIVDEATWKLMKKWQAEKKKADKWPRGQKSKEYQDWMKMLKAAQKHYLETADPILNAVCKKVDQLNAKNATKVDTYKVEDWSFDPDDIHLIGIRRREDREGYHRKNDDLFILLINGMVFKFWGSTDPSKVKGSVQEAFLVEGQHKFRFGWHNVSRQTKLYQGLNPFGRGVLVFRDYDHDEKLTAHDVEIGIDNAPNTTINIHWTGEGHGASGTWSAGCQVFAGQSYIDNLGVKRDCAAFAAGGTTDLKSNKKDKITKTKGAYNVFTDLILLFAPKRVDYLYYTLGRDDTLSQDFLVKMGGEHLLASAEEDFDLGERGMLG